jgi:Ca2+-binding EF-hand superfamily protein
MKHMLVGVMAGLLVAGGVGAQTSPVPPPSAKRLSFDAVDLNRDGFISLAEFHKDLLRSWHALDVDRDGYVSRDEVHQLPQHGPGLYKSLKRADLNGDGKLSFKEVVDARMDYFDHADANRDDQLSLAEVMSYKQRTASASPQRP